jgi:TetR/AcrR family transcriptional repressor of nem operon
MALERTPPLSDTASRILAVAERLAQTKGFNGFSYGDIAQELELTTATLHYHFANKAELGRVLLVRYGAAFNAALERIESEASDPLQRYVRLFEDVLVRDRMCLCGMLAAEYSTLPSGMQVELRRFFDANEAWLARQLERARDQGQVYFSDSALEAARTLTAGLEGAMLLARSYEEPSRFTAIAHSLLQQLRAATPRSRAAHPQRPRQRRTAHPKRGRRT